MPPRLRALLLPAAVAFAVLLTGCAAPAATDAPPTASPSAAPSALDFSAVTLTGEEFDGASLTGQPVVLWFWAPWCTVCRAESPDVAAVAAEYEGRVTFLGVGGRGPVPDMQAFIDQTGTDGFTHLADERGSIWTRFGVIAQPSFVFVAPDGSTESFAGSLSADDLRGVADRLIAG